MPPTYVVCTSARAIAGISVSLFLGVTLSLSPQLTAQEHASTPVALVQAMVAHEDDSAAHHDLFEFLSNERSDRTGGHMWTERVVEIPAGRIRLLLAEDGKPLSLQRQQQEHARLAAIVVNPDVFLAREQAEKNDEASDRVMLDLLPRGFLFDNARLSKGVWRMDFHPNPSFDPSGLEQRVLHGMSGWVSVDAQQQRLIHIEGHLDHDVSLGFGFLATIRAGSHFSSNREDVLSHWRTVHVLTDIRGKAILFKSVGRDSEVTRSDFHYLPAGITLAQAVALVEQPPAS